MNMICELRATYNDLLALQDQTDTIPLARALDAVGLALEAVVRITWTQYALNYMDLPKEKSGTLR